MNIELLYSTGRDGLDRVLSGVVSLFELMFPNRIRAYYLVGSTATGNAVLTSDLDIVVVFKHAFVDDEEVRANAFAEGCSATTYVPLDFALYTEARLAAHNYGGGFALTRKLIYGVAPRFAIPLPPIDLYTKNLMDGTHMVIHSFRGERLGSLGYPDPNAEFYGYVSLVKMADGSERPGLKEALSCACLISSSLLAVNAGVVVSGKSESVRVFAEKIGGTWASWLTVFYQLVREQFEYVIPNAEPARQQLHSACADLLMFERHFVTIYDGYVGGDTR